MALSPYRQLLMLCCAFAVGLLLGALWDVLRVLRVVLMAHTPPAFMAPRYRRPLPLLGVSVPFRTEAGVHRLWRGAVTLLCDLLFCLAGAVAAELLLFYFNDGVFRLGVPLLLLLGLLLWQWSVSRLTVRVAAWLAYLLCALLLYLRAALLLPWRLLRWAILRPAHRLLRHTVYVRKKRISTALCRRQLRLAAVGFDENIAFLNEKRKGKRDEQRTKKQKIPGADRDHLRADRGGVLSVADRHRQSAGGAPSQGGGEGAAGGAAG